MKVCFTSAGAAIRALRILVAAAGWLCMPFTAQAQKGYQSGYVITQDTRYPVRAGERPDRAPFSENLQESQAEESGQNREKVWA
jgi:hypothetical protein